MKHTAKPTMESKLSYTEGNVDRGGVRSGKEQIMRLIDAIFNVFILSVLMIILEAVAMKHGYKGGFPSEDARLIFDGLVIAGTLISRE